jgi:uncharacterized protein YggT (Ycf19 family)
MEQLLNVLGAFLQIYILCVLAWALISWLPQISPSLAYNDTVLGIRRFLDSVVLPYVRLFKFIKPLRIGDQLWDISALVAIILLQIGGFWILNLLRNLLLN